MVQNDSQDMVRWAFHEEGRLFSAQSGSLGGHDLRFPTLLVGATDDILVPPAEVHRLQSLLPHATSRWFEGSGHRVQGDAPDGVSEAMRAHIAGAVARASA